MGHQATTAHVDRIGEPAGTRTQDPRLKRAMLYRLSYRLTRKTSYHSRRLIVQALLVLMLFTSTDLTAASHPKVIVMHMRYDARADVAPLGYSALVMARTAPTPETSSYMASWDRWLLTAWLTIGAGVRLTAATEERQDPEALGQDNLHIGYRVQPAELWIAARRAGLRPVLWADTTETPMRGLAPRLGSDVQLTRITPATLLKRLQSASPSSAAVFIDATAMTSRELHLFVSQLRDAEPHTVFWLIHPVSPVVAEQSGLYAGWATRIGPRSESAGLLTSASTRLPGYITLPDITASVARDLGLPHPARWNGQPVSTMPAEDPRGHLDRLGSRIALRTQWSRDVGTLPIPQLLLLLLGALLIHAGRYKPGKFCLVIPITIPLAGAAVLPLCAFTGAPLWVARVVWLVTLLAAGWCSSHSPMRSCCRVVAAATLGLLLLAVLTEAGRWSGFGYSVQDGSRFYGIGNESAGALAGAVALLIAGQPCARQISAWLGCMLFYGWPALGANFGAALASLTGMITAGVLWLRTQQSIRTRILMFCVLGSLAALAWMAAALMPVTTHISRFFSEPGIWSETIIRKLNMNITLLRHSDWSALAALGILSAASAPLSAFMVCYGMLVFNDSGVLAAGTMGCWLFVMRYVSRPELNEQPMLRCRANESELPGQTDRGSDPEAQ